MAEAQPDTVPGDASDGMTVPEGDVAPPPGMESWREDDEPMPAAPEEPEEAEAHAGAEPSREAQPTTQEWLRAMAKHRNAAIEAELIAIAAGHTRVLKRKTSNEGGAGIEAPSEPGTNDYLKVALGSSLKIFGEHLYDSMAGIMADQQEMRGHIEGNVARIEALEQSTQEHADQTNRRLYRHDDALAAQANERITQIEDYLKKMTSAIPEVPARQATAHTRVAEAPPQERAASGSPSSGRVHE